MRRTPVLRSDHGDRCCGSRCVDPCGPQVRPWLCCYDARVVGLVVVVTGSATVATLYPAATLCWSGAPPSVTTLCDGWRLISVAASDFMIAFCGRCRLFFGNAIMDSLSLSCIASTRCVRLSVGRRQCCGKRLKDPDILWPPVSGTKHVMLQ